MDKISIFELKIFLSVAKYKNFTKASNKLFISQPTVTKWIKKLEETLGFQLFDRTSKTVTLTPAGEFLYEKYSILLKEFEDAALKASVIANNINSHLQIGALAGFGFDSYLSKYIFPFKNKYTDLDIKFNLYDINELCFFSDTLDVIFANNIEAPSLKGYTFHTLDTISFHLAVSKENPLAKKKIVSMMDIAKEKFLILPPDISTSALSIASEAFSKFNLEPEFIFIDNILTQLMLISENQGVTITGSSVIKGYEDRIALIDIEDFPLELKRIIGIRDKSYSTSKNIFSKYILDTFK